jgi:hypothetical protein
MRQGTNVVKALSSFVFIRVHSWLNFRIRVEFNVQRPRARQDFRRVSGGFLTASVMPDDAPEVFDPAEDCPWRAPREILARHGYAPQPPTALDDRQLPGRNPCGGWFHDILGRWGEHDTQLWLRYHATDDQRAKHAKDYPKESLPPKETPPAHRDWRLPKGPF